MVLNENLFSPYTIKMKKNITDENKILENNKMDKNSKSSIIQEYKNKTKKMPKFKDGSYKKDFIKYVRQLVKKMMMLNYLPNLIRFTIMILEDL